MTNRELKSEFPIDGFNKGVLQEHNSAEITLQDAIQKLCKSLLEDPEYYNSWQSNIAMAFHDEYYTRNADIVQSEDPGQVLHDVFNDAAARFLKTLIAPPPRFEDDSQAEGVLRSKGGSIIGNGLIRYVGDDPEALAAIKYLMDEWDFTWFE